MLLDNISISSEWEAYYTQISDDEMRYNQHWFLTGLFDRPYDLSLSLNQKLELSQDGARCVMT